MWSQYSCLNEMYSLNSKTRILHLRFHLQNIKKEDLSMSDYLKKISITKDKLAAAGEKLQESQIILITLGGLGMD